MLTIRKAQELAFADAVALRFEDQLLEHCQKLFPWRCEIAGEKGVREVIRTAMAKSELYDFDSEPMVQFYIELMFTLGADFHDDPQTSWADDSLRPSSVYSPQTRITFLYSDLLRYTDRVTGPDNRRVFAALRKLSLPLPSILMSRQWEAELAQVFREAFPEKYDYLGPPTISQIFEKAIAASGAHQFPEAGGAAILAVLMFAFGHGVATDPLYPWISATLKRERPSSEDTRLTRLIGKVRRYADYALQRVEKNS